MSWWRCEARDLRWKVWRDTRRLYERELVICVPSWMGFYEESKYGLLMVGEALQRGNVSMMIMGLAQRGQRKIAGWAGEDLLTARM